MLSSHDFHQRRSFARRVPGISRVWPMSFRAQDALCLVLPLSLAIWLPKVETPSPPEEIVPRLSQDDEGLAPMASPVADAAAAPLPGFGNTSPLSLIRNPQIQQALKLDEQQLALLSQISANSVDARRRYLLEMRQAHTMEERDRMLEEMPARLKEQAYDASHEVRDVLRAEQWQRLSQIAVQLRGIKALYDAGVQARLAMTEHQISGIQHLETQWSSGRRSIMTDAQYNRVSSQELRNRLGDLDRFIETSLQQILTPQQLTIFNELRGDKFDQVVVSFPRKNRISSPK